MPEIAEQLKLSITPVREALKLLEAEGYVSGDSYRGARVVPFDPGASGEILQLRLLLEAQLVRGAIEKITAQDIAELRGLANEFEAAFERGDRAEARGINSRFHRHLYDVAAMPQTLHFVQILWARYPFTSSTRRREPRQARPAPARLLLGLARLDGFDISTLFDSVPESADGLQRVGRLRQHPP